MTREKFPEKIPFRLTRMLTNAMEVRRLELSTFFFYFITCHLIHVQQFQCLRLGVSEAR